MNVIPQINDVFQGSYTTAVRKVFKRTFKSKEEAHIKLKNFLLQRNSGGVLLLSEQ